jgi:ubiquinone/menaquinone biosynthesis C-methylase UbiE
MEKEYYERYWTKESFDEQGFALTPPKHNAREMCKTIEVLKPYVSGCVLDVGCGDGSITNAIGKLPSVTEINGVDVSRTAISLAKSKYPHINFKVGQVIELPFKSNYFDAITAIELIEHIYDTEQMFKEFLRVLKNNGYLIITTTDFNYLKKVIIALFFWDKYFYPTNPHIRFAHRWNGSYMGLMPKGQVMIARKIKKLNPLERALTCGKNKK